MLHRFHALLLFASLPIQLATHQRQRPPDCFSACIARGGAASYRPVIRPESGCARLYCETGAARRPCWQKAFPSIANEDAALHAGTLVQDEADLVLGLAGHHVLGSTPSCTRCRASRSCTSHVDVVGCGDSAAGADRRIPAAEIRIAVLGARHPAVAQRRLHARANGAADQHARLRRHERRDAVDAAGAGRAARHRRLDPLPRQSPGHVDHRGRNAVTVETAPARSSPTTPSW